MKFLDALLEAICDIDEDFAKGLKIIDKFHEIENNGLGEFGERLANAPHENYGEILEHLEKVDELLGGNK